VRRRHAEQIIVPTGGRDAWLSRRNVVAVTSLALTVWGRLSSRP
jgi:hypothetical protein